MKKIIAIALLLTMCLGLFVGCNKEDNAALEKAKSYLAASYKDDDQVTGTDYQRGSVLKMKIDGVDHEFQVKWTASSEKIQIVAGENKMVNIVMPLDNLDDLAYTLTATITDDKGNSMQVSFDRKVPARPGIPTTVENGTYVIVTNGKSYTSLAADKSYGYNGFHEVTVENGVVSGHYKDDVITITNVEGGFTIQDAHGRYVYMKGTYNSCNVSAELPEDGHVWKLLTNKEGKTFIVNNSNMKTLAFDTQHSSWGAYPEITETRLSEVQLIKATAPEKDPEPETPDTPETPSTPSTPSTGLTLVKNPQAGVAYKFCMIQETAGKTLYLSGGMAATYYLATSENVADALDVYLEATTGGYYLYCMDGGVKLYINMVVSGSHVNGKYETTASTVYTYDAELQTLKATMSPQDKDTEPYVFGTYGSYTTAGPVAASKGGFFCKFYK